MRNALTFDVEEYFHVEAFTKVVRREQWPQLPSRVVDSTRRILDLLDDHVVRATFFVLGWVAERHGDLVREIQTRSHEIGCHSHAHRMITTMTPVEFRTDVRRARRAIEDATGHAVLGFRAPTFSIVRRTLWALDVLAEEGFAYDSSVFPIHHDRYGIPEAPRFPHRLTLRSGRELVEFPITTVPVGRLRLPLTGGGYFRLAPYALVRAGIARINAAEGEPAIVYLHPWELDPGQPRMPVRGMARFRHYVNLRSTADKLRRLLRDFAFGPAGDVLAARGLVEALR